MYVWPVVGLRAFIRHKKIGIITIMFVAFMFKRGEYSFKVMSFQITSSYSTLLTSLIFYGNFFWTKQVVDTLLFVYI